ncbi:hypothetical protein Taro_024923 [Colocasia esculenta]|uniref:Uncharacterized protein n=1 Tax=Colocasia esculenta TaxID=4460 RepID=A0A843V830_COLES|nr:hypothetical protein [Colocasia esculenta]
MVDLFQFFLGMVFKLASHLDQSAAEDTQHLGALAAKLPSLEVATWKEESPGSSQNRSIPDRIDPQRSDSPLKPPKTPHFRLDRPNSVGSELDRSSRTGIDRSRRDSVDPAGPKKSPCPVSPEKNTYPNTENIDISYNSMKQVRTLNLHSNYIAIMCTTLIDLKLKLQNMEAT